MSPSRRKKKTTEEATYAASTATRSTYNAYKPKSTVVQYKTPISDSNKITKRATRKAG